MSPLPAVIAAFTDAISNQVAAYGLIAIFVLMLLESACVPIPSEVTMLVGGALCTTGFAGSGNELTLVAVIIAGVLGNVIGSALAYWAGAAGGRPLVDRFGRYLLIRPHEIDRAHSWFETKGNTVVLVSRVLPVIRTFISVPAGVAGMPFGRFITYTTLGVIPWVAGLAALGMALGAQWDAAERVLAPFSWAIAIVVVIFGVILVTRRWNTVKQEYAQRETDQSG